MRKLLLTALVAGVVPPVAAAGECRESLARVEAASRAAQEALLVATARGEAPDLTPQMTALRESSAAADSACGELAAGEAKPRRPGEFLPEFRATDPDDAPKGSDRLQRSKRGY